MTTSTSTAVVTGGGRGIGFAIARRLAAAGHRVLITDIDEATARFAAARIGRGCEWVRQDVREAKSHRLVAAKAAEIGQLRVWVNNAGVLIAGDSWTHDDRAVASVVDVNLTGAIAGSRAAVQAMSRSGGRILNIASIAALSPVPGLAVYAATKAAVLSFTTSLQGDIDHAGLPIQARALCPDVVNTDMVTSRADDPGAAILFSGSQPLTADAVAEAGLKLLDSRQIFRVVPRSNGLFARALGLLPSVGIKSTVATRKSGERRQQSHCVAAPPGRQAELLSAAGHRRDIPHVGATPLPFHCDQCRWGQPEQLEACPLDEESSQMKEFTPAADTAPSGQRAAGLFESSAALDEDLRARIATMAEAERTGTEQFGHSRRAIAEAAAWVALGLLIWLIAVLVWA